jgi:hypothetical protein
MTAAGDESTGATPPYQPRPPLWQPTRTDSGSSWKLLIGIGVAVVGVIAVVTLGGESTFLSTPARPVEVVIGGAESVAPPNDAPADYRYAVRMPDGSTARYTSPDVHRVGDRLRVMESRGRLSGRTRLTRPRATLSSPTP